MDDALVYKRYLEIQMYNLVQTTLKNTANINKVVTLIKLLAELANADTALAETIAKEMVVKAIQYQPYPKELELMYSKLPNMTCSQFCNMSRLSRTTYYKFRDKEVTVTLLYPEKWMETIIQILDMLRILYNTATIGEYTNEYII